MRIALLSFLLALATGASAQTPYEMKDVVLLQPDFVLQERAPAASLVSYIRSANAAAAEALADQKSTPTGGFLVLAIRPGKQSAAWLDIRPALPPEVAGRLVSRLRAVPAPDVKVGPVVFALRISLWGGKPPTADFPTPDEWREEARKAGSPLEAGALVERIWPR